MNDEAGTFLGATSLPSSLTLAAGKSLVVASITADKLSAFKSVWGLSDTSNLISIDGPGLGKKDAVILFDSNGNVATSLNYGAATITASDGTLVAQALATKTFTNDQRAGAAYGSTATASAMWDGVSTSNPHYVGAVSGQLGAYAQTAKPASVGSPGIVEIIQSGVPLVQDQSLVA